MSGATDQANIHTEAARRLREAGDRYEALIHQRRAVALLRDCEDLPALAHAIRDVADMLVESGHAREADASITEMLALYRGAVDAPPRDIADAVRSAAVHAEAVGDPDAARLFWIEAWELYAGLDANHDVAEAITHLARLRR